MMHSRIINILLIEDDLTDVELIREILSEETDLTINIHHAGSLSSAFDRLNKTEFDIILSDLSLPDGRGIETFVRIHDKIPDIPIVVLTGLDDKKTALTSVRLGAQDYILKGQINTSHLLCQTIVHSIERHKLLTEIERKMREIRTLRGLIPMCAWCRKIRDDDGYWKKVEEYISEHTEAEFTHGICEECGRKAVEEFNDMKKSRLLTKNR